MNESTIENLLIQLLQEQGYTYQHGSSTIPQADPQLRTARDEVILSPIFKKQLKIINPSASESALKEVYQKLTHLDASDLLSKNEQFHQWLRDGIKIESFHDGETENEHIFLVDQEHLERNDFRVINQFTVKENNLEKRCDVVIFINGMPLVLIELKNPLDENADLYRAYTQIQNYQTAIPSLFQYNGLCVISDGIEARVAPFSAPFSRYLAWKEPVGSQKWWIITELEVLTKNLLDPATLLDVVINYTVFENEEQKDEETGQIFIDKLKKTAAYHQYYAVEKAIASTLQAVNGDRKIGVVRHTQGSWKSLSMVFYAGKLITHPELKNPTLLVITDRNDLDDQLFGTFSNARWLLRQTPQQAESREHLKSLLKVAWWGIVFSTIQKFFPEEGNVFDTLSKRENVIVIADEAHRSQYGFKAKAVLNEKTKESELRYGNAKYLRDALPNASFIGFTGTPIERTDKSTRWVFGDDIDVYDIKQAVEDGATVPISYESRLLKIWIDQSVLEEIDASIEEFNNVNPSDKKAIQSKLAKIENLIGNPEILELLAKDFVMHFEQRQEVFEGKAMVVAMSRKILVRIYDQIVKLRPAWEKQGKIKVIMTSSSDDPAEFQPHFTTSKERKALAIAFKNPEDPFQIALVCDMWLTGFDVPCLHTMYLSKRMQWAALMQAIARVNRVYKDKAGGLIVDYIGIAQDLRDAMSVYTQSGGTGLAVHEKEQNIAELFTKYEVVEQMFHGYEWKKYFSASPQEKLKILIGACDWIVQSKDLKQRFLKETLILNKLFTLAVPSPEADQLRDAVAFFQAIKTRIMKISRSRVENIKLETTIKQILDSAVFHWEVIDILKQ